MAHFSAKLSLAVLIPALFLPSALGQTLNFSTNITYNPQLPIPGVGHDYIHMVNETVNPADGNVSVDINIPLPAGRGLSVPFSIVYSSSNFGVMQRTQPNPYGSASNGSGNWSFLSSAGWSYTLPMLSYVMAYRQYGEVSTDTGDDPGYCPYASNYVFQAPGSARRHQFAISNVSGNLAQPAPGSGGTSVPGYLCSGQNSGSGLFVSLSGHDDQFQATLPSNLTPTSSPNVTVSDADGTIYNFSNTVFWFSNAGVNSSLSFPTFIEDRNGNKLTLSNTYGNGSTPACPLGICSTYGVTITDDMGRSVLSTSGFGVTGSTISASGLSKPYTLTWASNNNTDSVSVEEYAQSTTNPYCASGGTTGWTPYPTLGPGITTLALPNGQSYQFSYDPNSGLLTKITYPWGGYVTYTWGLNKESVAFETVFPAGPGLTNAVYCPTLVDQPAIVERQVSFDGQTIALTQTFSYSNSEIGVTNDTGALFSGYTTTVTTTDNVTGLEYATVYAYGPIAGNGSALNDPPAVGVQEFPGAEQSIKYYGSATPSGTPLLSVSKTWAAGSANFLDCEMHTLDNGETSAVFYQYGEFASVLADKKEYDFGLLSPPCNFSPPGSPAPTRETAISYQSFAPSPLFFQPYAGEQTLFDRPASVITYGNVGGASTGVAEANYFYDQTSTSSISAIDHDETNYSSGSSTPRGNATEKLGQCLQGCQPAITTYTYDETGQVASMTNPNGNQTTYSYADSWLNTNTGSYTTTAGSPPGNTNAYLTLVTYPTTAGVSHTEGFFYGYNDGQLTRSKDENGQKTTYYYNDPWSRPTEVTYPDNGQTTDLYNDSPYNTTTPSPSVKITKAITSSTNLTTIAAADGMGHPVQNQLTTDPDGVDYTFTTYDGLGHKHSVTNPYRSTSDSTYGTTYYAYDPLGRVTLVTEQDGSTIQTSYCGPSTLVTDEAKHWRRSTSDGLGRLIEVDEPDSATASVSACPQPDDPIVATKYTYDALNNLNTVVQNGSRQRTFVYDSLSRLLASFNPESNSGTGTVAVPASYATGTIAISSTGCTSDCSGDKVTVYVNGTGTGNMSVTPITTDETASSLAAAVASSLNSDSTISEYVTAAAIGGLVYLTSTTSGSAGDYPFSASVNGTSYTATASGTTLMAGGNGYTMATGSTTYSYDKDGNVTTKTEPAPNQTGTGTDTITYTYDALDRLIYKGYSDTTPPVGFGYDQSSVWGTPILNPVGHLTQMDVNAGAASVFSYDTMGRVVGGWTCTPYNCGSSAFPLTYTYDLLGDMTSYTAEGITFTQTFDAAGRVKGLTSSYSDAQHPPTMATVAPAVGYWPTGAIRMVTLGNGLTETAVYNSRLQPCQTSVNSSAAYFTHCTDPVPSGNVQDFSYGFNAGTSDNGNLASFTATGTQAFSNSYTYGALNRLQTMTGNGSCTGLSWSYDAWGNRIAQTQTGGTCYAFSVGSNAKNQLVGYQYDAAGDLLNDGFHSYTYDAENRIIQVDGGSTASYSYDALGQRLRKTTTALGAIDYIRNFSGEVLGEWQSGSVNTGWNREYVYLVGKLVAEYGNSTTYFRHEDRLGSATVLTGVNQAIYDSMEFLPFGEQTGGDTGTTHKFTGKERDTESGLDYFGFRHYGSSLGRFMQPDPAGMMAVDIGSPQTLNRYTYVLNNPLSFVDPFGLDCVYLNSGGTGVEKGGVDQSSSSGECGTTGGYWVNGSVTNVSIGGDAQTISLTGTNNGSDTTSASYQQDATVTVGEYNNFSPQTYNHIALGLLGQPQLGQNPRSDAHYLWALSMHGPNATVPGKIKPQVGGKLLRMARIRATGMQGQMLQNAMNQSAQNPPPYSVFGQTGCDCGTWAQQMLGDAGINSGPPAPLPDNLMDQLNQIYPQQPPQ